MDWNDLKVFLAVAREQTLTAASEKLGVSPSTVSRRIEMLESALNVQLFHPHRGGYDLTSAGKDLVPVAERAGAQMRVFERNAKERDQLHAGPVCIEAPELLGQDIILPMLGHLMQQYRDIRVELRTSVRTSRLVTEQADIVLRLVRPESGPYTVRKLGKISFGLFASRDHIASHGVPTEPNDLHQHAVIGWAEELQFLSMASWLDSICPGLQTSLQLNSLNAQLSAARHGLGWAVLPTFAAKSAELVPPPNSMPALEADLWLLLHEQSAALPRVTVIRDYLINGIRADDRFSGLAST